MTLNRHCPVFTAVIILTLMTVGCQTKPSAGNAPPAGGESEQRPRIELSKPEIKVLDDHKAEVKVRYRFVEGAPRADKVYVFMYDAMGYLNFRPFKGTELKNHGVRTQLIGGIKTFTPGAKIVVRVGEGESANGTQPVSNELTIVVPNGDAAK